MNKSMVEKPMSVSRRDAARMLGVSEGTLWNHSQPRGPIPCSRIGGRVLYVVDLLRRFLEEQAQRQ